MVKLRPSTDTVTPPGVARPRESKTTDEEDADKDTPDGAEAAKEPLPDGRETARVKAPLVQLVAL